MHIQVTRFLVDKRTRLQRNYGADGVTEPFTQFCAYGNTYPYRAELKQLGFKYNPNTKQWVKNFSELHNFRMIDEIMDQYQECILDERESVTILRKRLISKTCKLFA